MATDRDFVDYVHEQAGFGGRLTDKRMFGEYALYLDGKVVAFACDNSLLLKPTPEGRALLPCVTTGKPHPEAKDYYVLDEYLDDTGLLRHVLQATADVLPAPRTKAAKGTRGSRATAAAKIGSPGTDTQSAGIARPRKPSKSGPPPRRPPGPKRT